MHLQRSPHAENRHDFRRYRLAGRTRRDVIVVIFVVGMLLLVVIPLLLRQRTRSRRELCQQRQLAVTKAILHYESDRQRFPGYRNLQASDIDGNQQPTGWVFPILPYLHPPGLGDLPAKGPLPDARPPYEGVLKKHGPEGASSARGRRPNVYIQEVVCPDAPPSDPEKTPNWSNWVVNTGMPDAEPADGTPPDWQANGLFLDLFKNGEKGDGNSTTVAFVGQHGGPQATLLFSENVDSGLWTDHGEAQVGFVWVPGFVEGVPDPGDQVLRINQSIGVGDGSMKFARPSSYHGAGVNVAYVSGRLQFLNQDIDYLVFTRLMMVDSDGAKLPGTDTPVPPPYRRPAE